MSSTFLVKWIDGKRSPTCVPDLRYPNGVALDVTGGRQPACLVPLPYPAKRCGYYYVECNRCKFNVLITTAGRIDDPVSVRLPCKEP